MSNSLKEALGNVGVIISEPEKELGNTKEVTGSSKEVTGNNKNEDKSNPGLRGVDEEVSNILSKLDNLNPTIAMCYSRIVKKLSSKVTNKNVGNRITVFNDTLRTVTVKGSRIIYLTNGLNITTTIRSLEGALKSIIDSNIEASKVFNEMLITLKEYSVKGPSFEVNNLLSSYTIKCNIPKLFTKNSMSSNGKYDDSTFMNFSIVPTLENKYIIKVDVLFSNITTTVPMLFNIFTLLGILIDKHIGVGKDAPLFDGVMINSSTVYVPISQVSRLSMILRQMKELPITVVDDESVHPLTYKDFNHLRLMFNKPSGDTPAESGA